MLQTEGHYAVVASCHNERQCLDTRSVSEFGAVGLVFVGSENSRFSPLSEEKVFQHAWSAGSQVRLPLTALDHRFLRN
jgi:hypothetical protein